MFSALLFTWLFYSLGVIAWLEPKPFGRANAEARINGLQSVNVPSANRAFEYTLPVSVRSAPSHDIANDNLIVDTKSSNTWIGANRIISKLAPASKPPTMPDYRLTKTQKGSSILIDQVLSPKGSSSKINPWPPIPKHLMDWTAFGGKAIHLLLWSNLFSQGTIPANEFSVSFEHSNELGQVNGELMFGGIDPRKHLPVRFDMLLALPSPLTKFAPANFSWRIDQTITYGENVTPILSATADAFARYQTVTGSMVDNNTGLLQITRLNDAQ
ncbi:hypothetical protein PILCRDRAFT_87615 [Piloderma croceum F 1598]|uniref:Peptidase A1 domain-containing protein n=1 Tax=Piloderma croceum (strain F 1598) TaxID=765440 RepID=A0A0C3G0H8_PILCF|nr:hypothetical protein PILCRDRAFT_87615 [Piloderma croceum F 1598]